MQQLDKYTLGKTPAAIYLVNVLNESKSRKDRSVLKYISEFRKGFAEILNARESEIIGSQVMGHYCTLRMLELDARCEQMYSEGNIDPLVIDLTRNIIIGDIKKYRRREMQHATLRRSSESRARHEAKEFRKKPEYSEYLEMGAVAIQTYGTVDGVDYPVEVELSLPDFNALDTSACFFTASDPIDERVLVERSKRKLERRGKPNTFY